MTSRENQQKYHARAQSDNAAPVRTRKKGKNNNIPVHHDRIALPCEMSPPPGAPSINQIKGMPPVPGRVARRLPLSPRTNRPRLRRGSSARAIPPPVDPGTNKIAGQRQSPSPPPHSIGVAAFICVLPGATFLRSAATAAPKQNDLA